MASSLPWILRLDLLCMQGLFKLLKNNPLHCMQTTGQNDAFSSGRCSRERPRDECCLGVEVRIEEALARDRRPCPR